MIGVDEVVNIPPEVFELVFDSYVPISFAAYDMRLAFPHGPDGGIRSVTLQPPGESLLEIRFDGSRPILRGCVLLDIISLGQPVRPIASFKEPGLPVLRFDDERIASPDAHPHQNIDQGYTVALAEDSLEIDLGGLAFSNRACVYGNVECFIHNDSGLAGICFVGLGENRMKALREHQEFSAKFWAEQHTARETQDSGYR